MAFTNPGPGFNGPMDAEPSAARAGGVRRGGRWLRIALPALLCCALLASLGRPARAADVREYQLKAAMVFNFIKFVDWPAQRLPASSTTIQVVVAGRDAYEVVAQTIGGKEAKGRTIAVSQYTGPQDLARCHLLFISANGMRQFESGVGRTAGVLTVGETSSFARRVGIIGLKEQRNKLRFEINQQAAEQSGLTISSHLLKVAAEVL